MRDLGIGLWFAALTAAVGLIMAYLAIRYQDNIALWDAVLWIGVLIFALSLANIVMMVIYYCSDHTPAPAGEKSQSRALPDASSPLNETVSLICESIFRLPTVAPVHRVIELELEHPSAIPGGAGWIRYFEQPAGTAIDLLKGGSAPGYAYLCTFSNFGPSAILDLEAEFNIEFQEAIKIESGFRPGPALYSSKVTTQKTNLTANGGTFSFYVRNYSPSAFAVVSAPMTARGKKAGAAEAEEFTLASARALRFWLIPFPRDQAKSS